MVRVLRYRHLLLAFDGSEDAGLALEHALGMAQVFHARLAIVAVVPPASAFAWQAPGGLQAAHDASQAELEQRLRAAADAAPDDISVTTRLLGGDPAREILRAAREGEHDLIVLGSRGRGRVTAALLGSVSNHVMHEAEMPVIVVHSPREAPDLAA
jgi:nucleotide-binding universal stress UspA family protein